MKKILLMSLALVIICAIVAGASDTPVTSETNDGTSGDTRIYLSDKFSDQPLIFEKKGDCLTIGPAPSQPSKSPVERGTILDIPENDDCINAAEIGDVQNLPISLQEATADDQNIITAPNVWFLYTASTTGRVQIMTDDLEDQHTSRTMFAIYDGSSCPLFESFPSPVELQGGETIETATQITDPLPVVYTGTTQGHNIDYEFPCEFNSGPDVVYSYTADTDDSIAVVVSPLINDDFFTVVQVMDDEGYVVTCQSYTNSYNFETEVYAQGIFNVPVEAGETYYIVVSGGPYHNVDEGEYILKVFSQDYTVLKTSVDFEIETPGLLFDAVAGHQYLIEIGYEGADGDGFLSVMSVPTPANDECDNATDGGVLQSNVPIQFTGINTGAGVTNCTWVNSDVPRRDVWIQFTLEDSMNVEIEYCGNTSITDMLRMSSALYKDCPCQYGSRVLAIFDPYQVIRNCPNMTMVPNWPALPPGTYLYPMIVDYQFEGTYVINVTGVSVQRCSDDALFGQFPTSMFGSDFDFAISDHQAGYSAVDDFEDVTDTINQVSWWGLYTEPDDHRVACYPDSYPFRIIFCEYDEDTPFWPGDTVEVHDVIASAMETGNDFYNLYQKQIKLTAQLESPVFMERGWIVIEDKGINDCYFRWQNSNAFGNGVLYDVVSQQWTRLDYDLAFCLEFNDSLVSIDDDPSSLPTDFALAQNYPNPFNAKTSIQFSLKKADEIALDIYDIGGRLIKSLHHGILAAGKYNLVWDGTNESGDMVSSGIYFYRLKSSENVLSKSMVFLK